MPASELGQGLCCTSSLEEDNFVKVPLLTALAYMCTINYVLTSSLWPLGSIQ